MATPVTPDSAIQHTFLKYARLLAARAGTQPRYRSQAEIEAMYRHADAIIYPKRAERVMQED